MAARLFCTVGGFLGGCYGDLYNVNGWSLGCYGWVARLFRVVARVLWVGC